MLPTLSSERERLQTESKRQRRPRPLICHLAFISWSSLTRGYSRLVVDKEICDIISVAVTDRLTKYHLIHTQLITLSAVSVIGIEFAGLRCVDDNRTHERSGKFEIELLWSQFEDLIEHGKNKDAKTKLELLQRIYQLLAKTLPKNNQGKKVVGWKD
jgi:hypothetical protein